MTDLAAEGRAIKAGTGRGSTYSASAEGKGEAGGKPAADPAPDGEDVPAGPAAVEPEPDSEPEFKNDSDREIYEALRERPLTNAGLSIKLKRSANDIAPATFRMWKAGLLERLDEKDPPVRYGIPS